MPARNYRDLIVWKKAFDLTLAVYAGDFMFSQGREVWNYSAAQEGLRFNPVKYCGGGGKEIRKRIPPLPFYCSRVFEGS